MSAWASDDLASVIIRPNVEFAGWGQGIIKAWNPDTFENVIQYRGSLHENLPVASGLEALTYQPGDVVMLSRWKPSDGGGVTLRIGAGGRVIVPGLGAAAVAIASLRTDLGRQVALAVFGEAIHVDTVDGSASISDQDAGNDWIDLPGSPGPIVSNVEISESGRAWVFMTARLSVETHSTDAQIVTAAMSYMVSGQTSRQPNLAHALELSNVTQITSGGPVTSVVGATMTRVHTVIGLTPGVHTFQAKYTALVTGSGNRATFSRRELQVIPF